MDEAAAQAIHVVTETRNLKAQPFAIPEDANTVGREWEERLEGIEREFRYFKITDAMDKKDALIIYGGKEIARLEKSLPDPSTGDNYEKLKTKLNNHFVPRQNKHHARYQFLQMRPMTGESIISYTARLREKAKKCEFGDVHDERVLEHIIQTIDNKSIIQKTINKKWTLTQFLEEASQIEDVSRQVREMTTEERKVARIGSVSPGKQITFPRPSRPRQRQKPPHREHSRQEKCNKCGRSHRKQDRCPAFGKKCNNCRKWNHFAPVCQSTSSNEKPQPKPRQNDTRRRIRKTEQ